MTKRTKGQSIGERKNDVNNEEDDEATRKKILSTAVSKYLVQQARHVHRDVHVVHIHKSS